MVVFFGEKCGCPLITSRMGWIMGTGMGSRYGEKAWGLTAYKLFV
jgi:hypothetical protein